MARSLIEIAAEIRADWKPEVNWAAEPYVDAMSRTQSIKDMFGFDAGSEIVARFLCNAASWRGPVARRVKEELNAMLKAAR